MDIAVRAKARMRLRRRKISQRLLVWEKGFAALGYDPEEFRRDKYGALIKRSDYGKQRSPYGWEVDRIRPESRGGLNALSNLRPLHWNSQKQRLISL